MSADTLPNPFDILVQNQERTPDRIALSLPKESITYRDFVAIVNRYADILLSGGFLPGSKVVVMVKPGLELYAHAFALFKVKGIPVIVDPGMGLKRILASYAHVGAEVFIGIPVTQWIRKFAKETFASITQIFSVNGRELKVIKASVGVSTPKYSEPIHKSDLAFITFTTGSTGPAKAVEASHGILDAAVHIIRTEFDQGSDEKDLVSMPFFGLISLMIGSTVVIPDMNPGKPAQIDPKIITDTIQREGITSMLASPAFYDKLSQYAEQNKITFPTIKLMSSGGAPMSLDIMRRSQNMLGPAGKFYVSWGATEGLPLAFISVKEVEELKDSVISQGLGSPLGRPVNGVELEIIRFQTGEAKSWDERNPLPKGEIGEIIATGANVSTAYYKNPKADRDHKIVDPRGRIWHRTGDLGYFDTEDRLIFTGRMAHLVYGSETLHSVACEGVANTHPDAKRSALVDNLGQPVMVLELKKPGKDHRRIRGDVLWILHNNPRTRSIQQIEFHRSFPVDPRHNAKIERAKLALWARRSKGIWWHLPKIIPIAGWIFVFVGPFIELKYYWWITYWITFYLSTIAHVIQIPQALPFGEIFGYSKKQTVILTMIFGATFWGTLSRKIGKIA